MIYLGIDYHLLPYEKSFLEDEVARFGGRIISTSPHRATASGIHLPQAKLLTYVTKVGTSAEKLAPTFQSVRESWSGQARQSTRYGPHGLHDYKGKFHPQTPRSLILRHFLGATEPVLDPFAGTGTVLIEARGLGVKSQGVERNPIAWLISRAKLAWEDLPRVARPSAPGLRNDFEPLPWSADAERYLSCWFPSRTLTEIAHARAWIEGLNLGDKCVAQALLSQLLRQYSFQEPEDLRIRRRSIIPASPPFLETFCDLVGNVWQLRGKWVLEGLSRSQTPAEVFLGDSEHLTDIKSIRTVAGTVSSPPYATALPYVDTYRLSLVALGLAPANKIRLLEYELLGGRDVQRNDATLFDERLRHLPPVAVALLDDIKRRLVIDEQAGFRKRAVPLALARYLSGMLGVLRNLRAVERSGAPNLWVVGPNRTRVGGVEVLIDTPRLLGELAAAAGFDFKPLTSLDAFGRFGAHVRNAIRSETLLTFYG